MTKQKPYTLGADRHQIRFQLTSGGEIALGRSRKSDMVIVEHSEGGLIVSIKGDRRWYHLVASWDEWNEAWGREIVDAKLVRDYLNAKDEAEGAREGQVCAGRLAQRQQDAETALRQAVAR